MIEIRTLCSGGKGLFATKFFKKGSIILQEEPVIQVSPLSDKASKTFLHDFLGSYKSSSLSSSSSSSSLAAATGDFSSKTSLTLWNAIVPPTSIPTRSRSTFRGMVQAGICWIQQEATLTETIKASLLELYYPNKETSTTLENQTVTLAEQAVRYLKDHPSASNQEFQDWSTLEKVLLIWAFNSFEGGRIYFQISRINHDCNPNAVVQADGDTQRILAATDIAIGDEITISYLGLLLYAETNIRQEKLRATKYFECHCLRCKNVDDSAGCIPCPTCHPRELPQQSLNEDVQYDDEQGVTYISLGGPVCTKCKSSPSKDKKLQVVMKNVTAKVVSYLDTLDGKIDRTASDNNKEKDKDDDEDNEEKEAILEEHLGLASTIMGDRHWTTNLLKLIHLDKRLSLLSQAMLTSQDPPEMEDVAEAIDSLQRLERFVQSLGLKLDGGHILGDVIIGIARTLVSLGDRKSQKYAAEWLGKISEYVENFESDGKHKVVAALKVAWKNSDDRDEDNGPATKKLKSS